MQPDMQQPAHQEHSDEHSAIDLRRLLRALYERRWWLIGSIVVCTLAALIKGEMQTPMYEAQATVLVDASRYARRPGEQDVLELAVGLGNTRSLDTQVGIMNSRHRQDGAKRLVVIKRILQEAEPPDADSDSDSTEPEAKPDAGSDSDSTEPKGYISFLDEETDELVRLVEDVVSDIRQSGDEAFKGSPAEDHVEELLAHFAQPESSRTETYPPGFDAKQEAYAKCLTDGPVTDEADYAERLAGTPLAKLAAELAKEWVPELVRRWPATVTCQAMQRTDIIAIIARASERAMAMDYANALAQEHTWQSLRSNREAATQGSEWVDAQMGAAKPELEAAQALLADYLEENGLVAVSEAAAAVADRTHLLSSRVAELRAGASASTAEVASLRRQLEADEDLVITQRTTTDDPALRGLQADLLDLEEERAALLERVTDAHPDVAEIDARIRRAMEQIEERMGASITSETRVTNPLAEALLSQLAEAEARRMSDGARLATAETSLAEARAELTRLPEVEQQSALLQRDVQIAEKKYLSLSDTSRQLKLAMASEVSGVSTLDAAPLPGGRYSPNKTLNAIVGILVGVTFGFGLVLLVEQLDNTIKDPNEIEDRTGLPVLAVVPSHRGNGAANRLIVDPADSRQVLTEAFRNLRVNIRYASPDEPVSAIMVTSPGVGEGKTTVASNLAVMMADGGSHTLLVDCDLRRPAVAGALSLPNERGVTSCLVGDAPVGDVLQPLSGTDSGEVLTSGPIPPNPARLLESDQMRTLVEGLRATFDTLIIDTPPTGLIVDARVLAPLVDGVVMVLHAGKTRWPAFERALRQLQATGTRCLGVVMNNVSRRPGGYYYYYYYHHYGGYYDSESRGEAREPKNADK